MVATKHRNFQSIYIDYNGEGILLDCGEGTQRQMVIAGINAQKIKKILITHWHGDHVSGLVGLIQTLGNFSPQGKSVKLFGPKGTKERLAHLMNSCIFEKKLELEVVELELKRLETFYENDEYALQAISLSHSVPCIGYRFEKKQRRKMNMKKLKTFGLQEGPLVGDLQEGKDVVVNGKTIRPNDVSEVIEAKRVSFLFDTELNDACHELARGSDVLVSEAVLTHDLLEKAEEHKHLTARQAAQLGAQEGVGRLILTHFSQRYKETTDIEEDAKEFYPNVECAYDLLSVDLPF